MSTGRRRRRRLRPGSHGGARLAAVLAVLAGLGWAGARALGHVARPLRAALSVRTLAPVPDGALSYAPAALAVSHAYALTVSGQTVLSSLRPDAMYPIASTTKIMTAYLALQKLSLRDSVQVDAADIAVTAAQARQGGVEMPLRQGERLDGRRGSSRPAPAERQ